MRYIIPLAVLAFIVCGFAYYTLFSGSSIQVEQVEKSSAETNPAETDIETSEPTERESFSGEGSIQSLLTRGDNLECAVTYIPNPLESQINGSIFTYEGDLRGDFVVPTPDQSGEMVTSIIVADDSIWQWTEIDGDTIGSKQAKDFTPATLERLVSPVGFLNDVQYSCLTWLQVDYTIFEAPTSVLYTDLSSATFEEGVVYEEGEF